MTNKLLGSVKLTRPMCPQLSDSSEPSRFYCHCGLYFANKGSLHIHQAFDPKVSSHLRPILSLKQGDIPIAFNRPMPNTLVTPKSRLKCSYCDKSFSVVRGLQQHQGKVHSKKRKQSRCLICEKRFKDKHAVKYHIQQVHEKSTRVECKLCGGLFYNQFVYQRHTKNCPVRISIRDEVISLDNNS